MIAMGKRLPVDRFFFFKTIVSSASDNLSKNPSPMNPAIKDYHQQQEPADQEICELLATMIDQELTDATSKVWHGHPVWFLEDNPVVGYSKQKKGVRLMFWSGADFEEELLAVRGAKFKDASIFYNSEDEIDPAALQRWLKKSRDIQWDYKNIVKRKGVLERLR